MTEVGDYIINASDCHVKSTALIASDYGNGPARSVPPGQSELGLSHSCAFPFASFNLHVILISPAREELFSAWL